MSSTVLFFLQEINHFLETLSSFCKIEKALFLNPWDLILETRDSILEHFKHWAPRIQSRGSIPCPTGKDPHQFNHSVVHNLICKVNKHVALWLRLDSMALSMLLSVTVLQVSYFNNFANGSARKGLSLFTGTFPSSTAGLHLVLNTSCLIKKSRLVHYFMVECFHAIMIGAKHLHFRCEQYCIIFPSRNKSFPRNPFEFLHNQESLVSQSSGLDPRDSRLDPQMFCASRIEDWVSRFKFQVSTYFWAVM